MDKESAKKKYYENKESWNLANFNQDHFKRVKMVLDSIPNESTSLLDVGCGNGILCNQAQNQIKNLTRIVGFDQSLEAMKQVRTEKKIGDITSLPFKENEFDTICCLEVLEHISSDIFLKVIQELTRVAKQNIIISVPCNEKLEENKILCPYCKTTFHRYLHVQSFDSNRLKKLFEKYGFTCRDAKPIIKYSKKIGQKKFLKIIGTNLEHFFGNVTCPNCGHSDKKSLIKLDGKNFRIKRFIDLFWPSKKEFKWFLAVYEKQPLIKF